MEFRKPGLLEFEQLLGLLQSFKQSVGEEEICAAAANRLRTAIQEGKIKFFVALDNNEFVGMCSISRFFSTYTCEPSGIFEDFYILEERRNKGIARGLTDFAIREMQSEGVTSILAGCTDADTPMYKSLGFAATLGTLLACNQ